MENSRFVLVEAAPQQLQFVASCLVDRRSQYHQRNVTVPDPLDLLTVPQQRSRPMVPDRPAGVFRGLRGSHRKRSNWAEAKLPWTQQEHPAQPTATLALATADRQRSQSLEGWWTEMTGGVARIFGGKNIFLRGDGEDDR